MGRGIALALVLMTGCGELTLGRCEPELVYSGRYQVLTSDVQASPVCEAWSSDLQEEHELYGVEIEVAYACSEPTPPHTISHTVAFVPEGQGFAVEDAVFVADHIVTSDSAYSAFWQARAPQHDWRGHFEAGVAVFDSFAPERLMGVGEEVLTVSGWSNGDASCGDLVLQGVADGVRLESGAVETCSFEARVFFIPLQATDGEGDVLHVPPDCRS